MSPLSLPSFWALQWFTGLGNFFSHKLAAIKSLSDFVNNSRIVRECRLFLGPLSGRFSESPVWETVGPTSSPQLGHSFRNRLQLNWLCHSPRSNWLLCGNLAWPLIDRRHTSQLLALDRDIVLNTVANWKTFFSSSQIIVTCFRRRCLPFTKPFNGSLSTVLLSPSSRSFLTVRQLQNLCQILWITPGSLGNITNVIALYLDIRKECGSHSTTFAVGKNTLRKSRMLSTFSVIVRPLLGSRTDCFLSAWLSYHLLTSRM